MSRPASMREVAAIMARMEVEAVDDAHRLGTYTAAAEVHGVHRTIVKKWCEAAGRPLPATRRNGRGLTVEQRNDPTYQPDGDTEAPQPAPVDALQVTCWCQAHLVRVPRSEVLAGRTGSCNRRDCHPPAG